MKKILAMMLTAAMMLSMGTAVLAEEQNNLESLPLATKPQKIVTTIDKIYDVKGETTEGIFPAETLNFTATLTDAPGSITNPEDEALKITVDPLTVNGINNQNLSVNIPSYTVAGIYKYEITENDGETQGVTDYTDKVITLTVLVTYDYEDKLPAATTETSAGDGYRMQAEVGVTFADGSKVKDDTFTNTYEVGTLSVQKLITGNLADTTDDFDVYVNFTSDKEVLSTITYMSEDETVKIEPTAWEMNETNIWEVEEIKLTLTNEEKVTFIDIPAGVKYTVKEDSKYQTGDKDTDDNFGYDAPVYAVTGETSDKKVSAEGTYNGETVDASYVEGTINAGIEGGEKDEVVITNNKDTEIATGISVDSIPYLAMLGVVAVGGAGVVVSKKRRSED